MLQRKGWATREEIVKATGWQKCTVRGFISILGSKGGMKVTSTRREYPREFHPESRLA